MFLSKFNYSSRTKRKIFKSFIFIQIFILLILNFNFFLNTNAAIDNGADAIDLIGQYNDSLSDPQPVYTKSGNDDGPNILGFKIVGNGSVAVDTLNHRLFLNDNGNNRILVYNLDENNQLIDRIPDNVIGQPDFYSGSAANTQSGLNLPVGIVYDEINEYLFVSQQGSHRITVYDLSDGITNGEDAIYVIGQANFTSAGAAHSQSGLHTPLEIGYSSSTGQLFVSEWGGNRVKIFDLSDGITNGMNAINVLGQADFTTANAANTQSGMNRPGGITYDNIRNYLFVSEGTGNRVKIFDLSGGITDGMNAMNVLGQADFTTATAANTQSGLNSPVGLEYSESTGQLFVSEYGGHRVKIFDLSAGITDGMSAINVLGQSDFTTATAANTQSGMNRPRYMGYDPSNHLLYVIQDQNNRATVYDVNPATITDGANAVDLLGQYDDNYDDPQPVYTKIGRDNSPNKLGLNIAGTGQTVYVDEKNDRLFLTDGGNNRVLVYNLDSNHQLLDYLPDYVIGQPNFYTNTSLATQDGMVTNPRGLGYDSLNDYLFVSNGNRITVYDVSVENISNGMNAINIIGQADFTSNGAANSQAGLNAPQNLLYDEVSKRLFVAESSGHRVKIFDLSGGITDGMPAINVLGQATFTTATAANSQTGLNVPVGLAYDNVRDYLFVSESSGHRVKIFNISDGITDGEAAINVIGQADFTTATAANTQSGLNVPQGVSYDQSSNRLFVSEVNGRRVKVFDLNAITDGEVAVNVLGQSSYITATAANSQSGMNAPRGATYDNTSGNLYVIQSGNHRISIFDATDVEASSISGTLYDTDGVTPLANKNISVSVGGGLAINSTTTNASGEYTVSGLKVNPNNVLTIFVDDENEKAVVVTKASGSDMNGIDLRTDFMIVRCDNNSCSITNTDISVADDSADTDITEMFTASGSSLNIAGGKNMLVSDPGTYNQDGTLNVGTQSNPSELIIEGAFTGGNGKTFIFGDILLNSGTLTAPSGSLILNGEILLNGGTFDDNDGNLVLHKNGIQELSLPILNNLYINNGLVGYWDFNENDGNIALDKSGVGNHGTYVGSPEIEEDVAEIDVPLGKSLKLTGNSGQYVNVPHTAELSGARDITVSTWIKNDTVDSFAHIATKGASGTWKDWVFLRNGNKLTFGYEWNGNNWDSNGLSTVTEMVPDTWYHGAFTYDHDTQTVKIYLNGQIEAATVLPTITPSVNQSISIGRRLDGSWPGPFSGNIDEVRIYNRVLSEQEMLMLGTQGVIEGLSKTTLNTDIDINGNLYINGSELDVSENNHTINLSGDFSNMGSYTSGDGEIIFDGLEQTIYGNTSFYDFTKIANSSSDLYFQSGSTQTITNLLKLKGGASNYLSLLSAQEGSMWNIDPQSTRDITGVQVSDSNNINQETINATGLDLGNNINWSVSENNEDDGPGDDNNEDDGPGDNPEVEEESTSRIISTGSGVRFGCKDTRASNYEYFSSHKQELCEYDDSKNNQELQKIINQYRDLLIKLYNSGVALPKNVLDILGLSSVNNSLRDLDYGMEGDDVVALQKILIKEGYAIPAGPTGYFGLQTQSALTAYQIANSVSPASGYFGSITRLQMKDAKLEGLWW